MTTMVSFSSSSKQGAFQVHDITVCLFCPPQLVKLNKFFKKIAISSVYLIGDGTHVPITSSHISHYSGSF